MEKKELELIEFKLDGTIDNSLQAVSIVKDPAIEKSFQLFSAIDDLKKFNKELFQAKTYKQEITGPVMIPDIKILRINEKNEYYNCFFSADTIKECASIYLKNCNHLYANFDHTKTYTNKIHVTESWIVTDPNLDKSKALGFEDVKPGTWFMTYKVDDKQLFEQIMVEGFSGFSIEGWFTQFEKQKDVNNKEAMIYSILQSKLSDKDKESIINRIINTIK